MILQLHAIAYTRLFGDGPWLADRESGSALSRTFLDMALEALGGGSIRPTGKPIGRGRGVGVPPMLQRALKIVIQSE